MYVRLLQFPVDSKDKKKELENLFKSSQGLEFTKKQKGFISTEYAWSNYPKDIWTLWLWEKWETKEDYDEYLKIRKADTEWFKKFMLISPDSLTTWLYDYGADYV